MTRSRGLLSNLPGELGIASLGVLVYPKLTDRQMVRNQQPKHLRMRITNAQFSGSTHHRNPQIEWYKVVLWLVVWNIFYFPL